MSSIPEEWIKRYVDQLILAASSFPSGLMRDAAILRADHAMDLVKAWRESSPEQQPADYVAPHNK